MAKLLIERGADIESKNMYGKTPLHWGMFLYIIYSVEVTFLCKASQEGRIEVAKLLVKRGADVESKTEYGGTPLIIGIFLNYVFNFNYFFILFTASSWDNIEVVKLLVERGADVESKDHNGWTPLHWGIFLN